MAGKWRSPFSSTSFRKMPHAPSKNAVRVHGFAIECDTYAVFCYASSKKWHTCATLCYRMRYVCSFLLFIWQKTPYVAHSIAKSGTSMALFVPRMQNTPYVLRFFAFGEPREASGPLPGALGGPGCAHGGPRGAPERLKQAPR